MCQKFCHKIELYQMYVIFHITSIDMDEGLCKISLLDHGNTQISAGIINSERSNLYLTF